MAKQTLYSNEVARELTGELVGAIRELAGIQHEGNLASKDVVEYGYRHYVGQTAVAAERRIRVNGVESEWLVSFTANVGGTVSKCDFDQISIFNPQLVVDDYGNKFRAFKKFYYSVEFYDGYEYHWFCEQKANPTYKCPKEYMKDGAEYYDYHDVAVYEGASEVIDGKTYLVSKSGMHPLRNTNRTTFRNYAKAWNSKVTSDTEEYDYDITRVSEITEILTPLLVCVFGTRNAQSVYRGSADLGGWSQDTVTAYEPENKKIYLSASAITARYFVGNAFEAETTYGNIGNTRNVVEAGEDYIIHDGEAFGTVTKIAVRPIATGQTDSITATHGSVANDGKHSFKVFGIENIYANIFKHVADVTIKDYVPYVCEDMTRWSDVDPDTNSAFKKTDVTTATSDGYATKMTYSEEFPQIRLTAAVGGSGSTHYCDYYWRNAGVRTVFWGGCCVDGVAGGPFCWRCGVALGSCSWGVGGRLSRRRRRLQGGTGAFPR